MLTRIAHEAQLGHNGILRTSCLTTYAAVLVRMKFKSAPGNSQKSYAREIWTMTSLTSNIFFYVHALRS